MTTNKITIGVSSCLSGKRVRYDGGHKRIHYIAETLPKHFNILNICPEVELGMGIPREAVRLENGRTKPRIVTIDTRKDITTRMVSFYNKRVNKNDIKNITGFVFKSKSPSCGIKSVKVYKNNRIINRTGTGIFVDALKKRYPHLPIVEERQLENNIDRENFVKRVIIYYRLKELCQSRCSKKQIQRFIDCHKYLLIAHSFKHYRLSNDLILSTNNFNSITFKNKILSLYMKGISLKNTKNKNKNVLKKIYIDIKKYLTSSEQNKLSDIIDNYSTKDLPLSIPAKSIKQYCDKYNIISVKNQVYLNIDF